MICEEYFVYDENLNTSNLNFLNPLKTSIEYTRAGVYGKCML